MSRPCDFTRPESFYCRARDLSLEIDLLEAENERLLSALNRIDGAVTSGTLGDIRRIAREALKEQDG